MHYSKMKMIGTLAAIVLASFSPDLLAAENQAERTSYNLKVSVSPDAGSVAVRGRLEFSLKDLTSREFTFGLHETFAIKKLLVNGKAAVFSAQPAELSPMTPAKKNIVVTLPPGIASGRIQMDIEYGGRLKKLPEFGAAPEGKPSMDDQVNSHLVELAAYSSWYPQFEDEGQFQVELEVTLPAGWIAICSGKKIADPIEAGGAVTRWSSPNDFDILIVASPDFKKISIQQSGTDIEIYHTRMPKEFIDREGQQVASVMKLFTDTLGKTNIPGGTVRHVYSPKRKGQGKAGIARPGLIVTSEGLTLGSLAADSQFSLFQPIAHEIAHFWWNFGVGQGDWVNEAFSEYFSAIAVRKIASESEFKIVLEDYRNQVRALPAGAASLATVPFLNDEIGFVVRYYKGAVMLDHFKEVLGETEFLQASNDFFQTYQGRPTGTAEFRDFWKQKLADRGNLVDAWLDSRGGLPDSASSR